MSATGWLVASTISKDGARLHPGDAHEPLAASLPVVGLRSNRELPEALLAVVNANAKCRYDEVQAQHAPCSSPQMTIPRRRD